MASVFVAVPHYGGIIAEALPGLSFPSLKHDVRLRTNSVSLLAFNFNSLWCQALNERDPHKYDYFAMVHSDIAPPIGWVDMLIDELEHYHADLMSVVVPMKSGEGLTSTAWHHPITGAIRRITIKELGELPETFSNISSPDPATNLLVNSGCWVCRFDQPWAEKLYFHIDDSIIKTKQGKFEPRVFSEDWHFSRQFHNLGLHLMATQKIKLHHHGHTTYPNHGNWGSWDTDKHAATCNQHPE
jgi:hypothetical protein